MKSAKPYLSDVVTSFPCDWVELGDYIEEVSENMGSLHDSEVSRFDHLRGVSNEHGIVEPPFDRVRLLKNPRRYVVLRMGYFAYNPMRINVGSIGLFGMSVSKARSALITSCSRRNRACLLSICFNS